MTDTIFLIKESDSHEVAKLLEENEIPFKVDEIINTDYLGTPKFFSKMNKKAQLNKIVTPKKPLKKVAPKAEIMATQKIREKDKKAQLNKTVTPKKPLKKVASKAEILAIQEIRERNKGVKPAKDLGSYNNRVKFAKEMGYKDISDAIRGIGSGRTFARRFKDEFVY